MSELTIIEEAAQRTQVEVETNMTLVQLCFARGHERARALTQTRRLDAVAVGLFEDAFELLVRPKPAICSGLAALRSAAEREPEAYAATDQAVWGLMLTGIQATVDAELGAAARP